MSTCVCIWTSMCKVQGSCVSVDVRSQANPAADETPTVAPWRSRQDLGRLNEGAGPWRCCCCCG